MNTISAEQKQQKRTGADEWCDYKVNLISGCAHNCVYCYAKRMAKRAGQKTDETWPTMVVREHDVKKGWRKHEGRGMMQTSSDFIPSDPSFESAMDVLEKVLKAGNKILLTTKPHEDAIKRICNEFAGYREQVQFRFTITSMDDKILSKWEPHAPSYLERRRSMEIAWLSGFETSVSIEPVLDYDAVQLLRLVKDLRPLSTGSIWVGAMNYVKNHGCLRAHQIFDAVKDSYGELGIRFKDSIRKAMGMGV